MSFRRRPQTVQSGFGVSTRKKLAQKPSVLGKRGFGRFSRDGTFGLNPALKAKKKPSNQSLTPKRGFFWCFFCPKRPFWVRNVLLRVSPDFDQETLTLCTKRDFFEKNAQNAFHTKFFKKNTICSQNTQNTGFVWNLRFWTFFCKTFKNFVKNLWKLSKKISHEPQKKMPHSYKSYVFFSTYISSSQHNLHIIFFIQCYFTILKTPASILKCCIWISWCTFFMYRNEMKKKLLGKNK